MRIKSITIILIVLTSNILFSQKTKCGWEGQKNRVFTDFKGNELTISGSFDEDKKVYYDSEFFISDTDNICHFYKANNYYKIEILKDTLNIYELHDLCIKKKFECDTYEINKTSYYFKSKNFVRDYCNITPIDYTITQQEKENIYKTIDNIESLYTEDVSTNLININIFIKKLEALAILGDVKSLLKLIEFNQMQNPELSYSSMKATEIVLDLYYPKKLPEKLYEYLMHGYCKD